MKRLFWNWGSQPPLVKAGWQYIFLLACLLSQQKRCSCWPASVCLGSLLPWWPNGKESACSAGGMGLILRLGSSPREGNGYPLQYSRLKNSTDRGAWQATVHGVVKSQTWLKWLTTHTTAYHRLGGRVNNRNLFLQSSGGWEVQDQDMADLVSSESLLPGLQTASCCSTLTWPKGLGSSLDGFLYKSTDLIHADLTLMT